MPKDGYTLSSRHDSLVIGAPLATARLSVLPCPIEGDTMLERKLLGDGYTAADIVRGCP